MRKLKARIIIYVGVALLLGLGIYCFIGIRIHNAQLIEERVRIISAATDMMQQNISNSMLKSHTDELQFIMENMGKVKGIEEVKILDNNGRIRLASDPEKIGKEAILNGKPLLLKKPSSEKEADFSGQLRILRAKGGYRAIGLTTSIKNEKQCWRCHDRKQPVLGTLDMVISIANIDARVRENRNRAIVFGFLTFILVSAAVVLFVQYSIYPNIKKIIKGTEKIRSGEYGYSIPVKTEDEIGWLARAFNAMSLRLKKQKEEEIEEWKREMEQKVKQATSELEKTNQQLTKAIEDSKKIDKMKTDVAMVIYHDLRSPLAAIQSCLNVVMEGIVGEINPRQKDMLRRADEDIDKLLTFITDLLDLSQIEVTTVERSLQPTQLSAILTRIINSFATRVEQKGMTFNVNIPLELPIIYADSTHMEQVFRNIIGNAIKYTKQGGKVDVKADEDGGFVIVTVADTGIGISEEDLPKIFDIFYRAPNAKAAEKVGTGLGLSIAKRIIDDHWGTISVSSRLSEGSVFTIKLPRAKQI